MVSLGVLALTRPAAATPYETFIDVDDQADLEDLLASGDITTETYEELLELLQNGVDLNTADRAELYALPNLTYEDVDAIIAYREQQKGAISDPAGLVAAGALTEDKLLAISAFILIRPPGDKFAVRGWVRLMTRMSVHDKIAPPLGVRGRIATLKNVHAGFAAAFTRLEIGKPIYDPNRGALVADPRGYGVNFPKAYVKTENDKYSAILGTYRAGFAQRLTFDNSRRYTPNGLYQDDQLLYATDLESECRESAGELAVSPCAGASGARYVTPDWIWRDSLLGAGLGYKHLELGTGWLQAYGWASIQQRSIYQYELVDRGRCEDPHDDNDPACVAPNVYVTPEGSPLSPTSRHSFQTLRGVFQEQLAGANVTYFADRRNAVGVTAYAAREKNLVDGIELDTQEWSRIPTGLVFGAAGANFSFGRGWLDVFGEAAFSFDEMPDGANSPQEGGGGPGAIVRMTATKSRQELEAVFRYFGIDYANPYARPIAQSDEFEGQRARDEVGGRLRYVTTHKRYSVRALVDLWAPVSSFGENSVLGRIQPKLDTYARADVRTSQELWLGLWLRFQDKDLRAGGNNQCFEISTELDETGEPLPCAGRQLTSIARVRYQPNKQLHYTAMLQHQLLDDNSSQGSPTAFRQDLAAWLIAMWRPSRDVRVRGRARFLDEAITNNEYLERSVSALVDGAFVVRKRDTVRVRVDTKFWLDERDSTKERVPNPEFQVWLSYEARL